MDEAAMAQQSKQMVIFAKIQVDPAQLNSYNAALKEQMTTSITVVPSVSAYYALADKNNPSHITILEIYADKDAYKAPVVSHTLKNTKQQLNTWSSL